MSMPKGLPSSSVELIYGTRDVDDFVKENTSLLTKKLDSNESKKRAYKPREPILSVSEVMTICIAFHQSNYRNLKAFYLEYVFKYLHRQFPKLVSYNRFIEIMSLNMELLARYLQSLFSKATGISFIDSTPIQVCKPKRMSANKVFADFAKKSKSTIGWFFGFKLHLIVNECGELLAVKLTKANVDDRTPVPEMASNLFGKLFGDKGYISKELTGKLREQGVNLITGLKKNMKNKLLPMIDKILLRKRSIIETINDQLKNISQIEHSRHRSVYNFVVNILCGLIAYCHQPKKPTISPVNMDLFNMN
jgi:hypothetical protein